MPGILKGYDNMPDNRFGHYMAALGEAKLTSGAPLKPSDLVDVFLSFRDTCMESIERDIQNSGKEFGPDDKNIAFTRATSVALSRLAARLGPDSLKKLAAALDMTQARTLFVSSQTAIRTNIAYFTVFLNTLYQNLPEMAGVRLDFPEAAHGMNYSLVNPATREQLARIDAEEAQELAAQHPYDPAKGGVRPLASVPPPANPAGLPQTKEARKTFLKAMLPIYHANEKGFDYGFNYHGRGHATRAFVFSIAMSNILKEKGVPVDLNAVALGTAGHDSGRTQNGNEIKGSKERSADNVNAKIDEMYPGAAGDAWKGQVKSAITTVEEKQTTIEGYVFKSVDSIEIARLGEINMKKFPFLREPIVAGDGLVVMPDRQRREALIKEAQKLGAATSPRARLSADIVDRTKQMLMAKTDVERNMFQEQQNVKVADAMRLEKEQTDTFSDDEIVELVEKTIRDNPQDYPLLTKYYLNAE